MGKRIELTDIYRPKQRLSEIVRAICSPLPLDVQQALNAVAVEVAKAQAEPKRKRGRPKTQTPEQRKDYLKRKAKERRDRQKAKP